MITSNVFHVVLPLSTFFPHIPPIPNIKTCSISLPLSLDACKENIGPTLCSSNFMVENAFVYTASRTLVSVQIPMKKIEMTVLKGKKKRRETIPS